MSEILLKRIKNVELAHARAQNSHFKELWNRIREDLVIKYLS